MPIQSLSKDELLRLLGQARSYRERDWLMILVAYWHGLRASEVVHLARDDVHDGYITVQRLKGSNKTTQPLIEHAEPLLNERQPLIDFISGLAGNEKIFPVTRQRFWQLWQYYGNLAGIPEHKRHPHVAKHSIAMHVIDDAGVHNTRTYLGHKSLSSTGAYLQVTDDEASEAIRKARRTSDDD